MSNTADQEKSLSKLDSTDKTEPSVHVDHYEVESGPSSHPEKDSESQDDVFTVNEDGKGADFRGVSWIGAATLIVKSVFGLGVLGLPGTFNVLGFVPGLISLVIISAISTWTGLFVGQFRLRHPSVHSIGDAAQLLFGRMGLEIIGALTWLYYTLCFAAALLTLSIALNTFTDGKQCTLLWFGVGAIISLVLGLFTRTMKVLSWMSYIAVASICAGVWITAIACLAQSEPAAAPAGQPVDKDIRAFRTTSFAAGVSAVAAQAFSFASTASFFTIHAEMRNQKDYPKALLTGQGIVVFNYIVLTCIVYGRVGQYIASPALGSAGPLFKKISYGVAMPALVFTAFFQAHIAAKYAMVRFLRGTRHLQGNTVTHWSVWGSNIAISVAIGFVVAAAIPFFNDLLGLIGALLGTTFSMILPGLMYLYEARPNDAPTSGGRWIIATLKARREKIRSQLMVCVASLVVLIGVFIAISGTYGSIKSISDTLSSGTAGSSFSCGDNSGS